MSCGMTDKRGQPDEDRWWEDKAHPSERRTAKVEVNHTDDLLKEISDLLFDIKGVLERVEMKLGVQTHAHHPQAQPKWSQQPWMVTSGGTGIPNDPNIRVMS